MIIKGMRTLNPKSALSYPAYLNKYGVSYEMFPEVWQFVMETLKEHGAEITV